MTESPAAPTLLAVAHGTEDPNGLAEVRRLINIVRTKRPGLRIELCWLDRAEPSFPEQLAAVQGPLVVVPVLLSTGYHVKVDIAEAVAGRPQTAVAQQLGPDPRISQVVFDRLMAGREEHHEPTDVVLFSAGSSDPEAFEQLKVVAAYVQAQLHKVEHDPVQVWPAFLSREEDWAGPLPDESDVATYLLAPGRFNDMLRDHCAPIVGARYTAAPIGAHPQVAAVICDRYDEAAQTLTVGQA